MTTRAEALLEALEQVDDSIVGVDNRIAEALQIIENNNSEHAQSIIEAADLHGKTVEKAGSDIAEGLIVGAAVFCVGLIHISLINLVIQRTTANRQFVQMFDSVVCIFRKNGPTIPYDFVLKRSYAEGTTSEERQTLLNGLIYLGIVEDNYNGEPEILYLDPDSDHIAAIYNSFEEQGLIVIPE